MDLEFVYYCFIDILNIICFILFLDFWKILYVVGKKNFFDVDYKYIDF